MESPLPLSELDQSGSNAPLVHINDVAGFSPLSGLGVSRYRYSYPHSRHLDSLLVAKESDTLIVQFHGAVNREKVMLPRFERLATLSSQNVSSMYFADPGLDRNSTRLNSSHVSSSYAVFCCKQYSYAA